MITEIATAITAMKSINDITSLILKAKIDAATREKAIELQSSIISLQNALFTIQIQNQDLLREKNELEQRLIEIESWEAQSKQYKLQEITTGVFVMASKTGGDESDPIHWLCLNCYEKRQKSVLQYNGNPYDGIHYLCPNCKNEIVDWSKSWNPIVVA